MAVPKKDEGFLIDPNDFKSIELSITLENTTTKTMIKDGRRIFQSSTKKDHADDSKNLHVLFVELLKKGMVLELPIRTAAGGHNLVLDIAVSGVSAPFVFHCSSKVDHVTTLDNGKEAVRTTLVQFDSDEWDKFKDIFSARQAEIFNFFDSVKGS